MTKNPETHPFAKKIFKGFMLFILLLVLLAYIIIKFVLADYVRDYLNAQLQNMNGYYGHVAAVDLDLIAGRYRLEQFTIKKSDGKIQTPFFDAKHIDFTLDWRALFHGRILSSAWLYEPQLNFAVKDESKQYGQGQDWTEVVKKLMPIDINRLTLINGKVAYKDFSTNPKVDIYILDMNGHVENLRNVTEATQSLPSSLTLNGISLGHGKLTVDGRLNILRPFPDMDLNVSLTNTELTELNSFPEAYAAFSFKHGKMDFYSHLTVKNSKVTGTVKPIITDLAIDIFKSDNPVIIVWNGILSVLAELFTNQEKNQFATKASLEGNLNDFSPNGWEGFVNIFHNAFIEAFNKGFSDLKEAPAGLPRKNAPEQTR